LRLRRFDALDRTDIDVSIIYTLRLGCNIFQARRQRKKGVFAKSSNRVSALWIAIVTRNLRREAGYAAQANPSSHKGYTQSAPQEAAKSSQYATPQFYFSKFRS
jgi:hypothetical protein